MRKRLLNFFSIITMLCIANISSAFTVKPVDNIEATLEFPECYRKAMPGRYEHRSSDGRNTVMKIFHWNISGLTNYEGFCRQSVNVRLENQGIYPVLKEFSTTNSGHEVFKIMYVYKYTPDIYRIPNYDVFEAKAVINLGNDRSVIHIEHSGLLEDATFFNDIVDSFSTDNAALRQYGSLQPYHVEELPANEVLRNLQGKWYTPDRDFFFEIYGNTIYYNGQSYPVQSINGKGTVLTGSGFVHPTVANFSHWSWTTDKLEISYYNGKGPHTQSTMSLYRL